LIGFLGRRLIAPAGKPFFTKQKHIFLSFCMLKKLLSISVFISIVFLILLTTPVISAFNSASLLFGIPTLYLYIISLWVVFVGLMMWITSIKQYSDK